ncbi:VOC family protein [Staphylococcus shinii]|jgi:catechol 2,3-dioxygenase-like lactoylglutathione lyase family enzyme|uniref:VOC family protein n=1 Tax=Staphylococcus shinii TaxID=2912228 RepID=A0A418IBP5_9STAP|nr:VOC family protein [Staphylococcus shinii]MBO3066088.1 VOC family protein [Staphylococcus shinii]MDW8564409.1 VOC family protein [Staphylococcus shinii]MDW8567640.1 VOC family protein [Staphylococcus shinii]RIM95913.1 VOC family protein [Staphylococcus shinii]RIN04107.1 VOC family protein [Staphylococcus shinii]
MKIIAMSIFVNSQDKAQQVYTEKLGFKLKHNIEIGGDFRWLTVTEENSNNPVEIVLEPNESPIAKNYQDGLYAAGIPVTMFGVDNLEKEYEILLNKGIEFYTKPKEVEGVKYAIFDDTCGNLIQIVEQ